MKTLPIRQGRLITNDGSNDPFTYRELSHNVTRTLVNPSGACLFLESMIISVDGSGDCWLYIDSSGTVFGKLVFENKKTVPVGFGYKVGIGNHVLKAKWVADNGSDKAYVTTIYSRCFERRIG